VLDDPPVFWMVTCVSEDRQTVLRSHPEGLIRPGAALPWERSLCRQMVEGSAPRMATVTAAAKLGGWPWVRQSRRPRSLDAP
jgi:hypothetical protein